ncbi:hypothetical protein [Nannocystis sp. SCPEA4]|uniref:hypothetical protein n=1 Tax=Nannocystis sp. SCPEA4 TaxID=2996787 RepID=UPI00226F49AE|nr:hypothetical protein [Nannocystis sp. SCPEA4]MCY1057652.1 hypothetical protein [Nannocystis sp. SCPEA4]
MPDCIHYVRPLLLLAVLDACAPGKAGDTDDTTDTTAGTAGTDTTGDEPTAGTSEGGASGCDLPTGARAQFEVEWGVPSPSCDMEVCVTERSASCLVNALGITAEALELTLDCEYPDLGPSTDLITIEAVDLAIDLAVGDPVDLSFRGVNAFEDQPDSWLRLTDSDGLVLAVADGGSQNAETWAGEFVSTVVAPLTAELQPGCDDELEDDAQIVFTHAGQTVAVPHERWSTLTADGHTWVLDVRRAIAGMADPFASDLSFAVLRRDPAAGMP